MGHSRLAFRVIAVALGAALLPAGAAAMPVSPPAPSVFASTHATGSPREPAVPPSSLRLAPIGTSAPQRDEAMVPAAAVENLLKLTLPRMTRGTGSGREVYRHGVWSSPNATATICTPCDAEPGVAAAALYRVGGGTNATYYRWAVDSVNALIRDLGPNGDVGDSAIWTAWSADVIGNAWIELQPYLPPALATIWRDAVTRAANYLVSHGDIAWYTNGNIELSNVETFYWAWRMTGSQAYASDYHAMLTFAENPPQARWPGYGLVISPQGNAGYLTEDGGNGPGFDPGYTELQLEVASQLYVVSGDQAIAQLLRLELNMELPLVGRDWNIDDAFGTRHPTHSPEPFWTSALVVMAALGGHTGLSEALPAQVAAITVELSAQVAWGGSPGDYRAFGQNAAAIIEAAQVANRQITQQLP